MRPLYITMSLLLLASSLLTLVSERRYENMKKQMEVARDKWLADDHDCTARVEENGKMCKSVVAYCNSQWQDVATKLRDIADDCITSLKKEKLRHKPTAFDEAR